MDEPKQPEDASQGERPATGGDGPDATIERIELDEAGRLVVHLAGRDEPVVDAKVARCFPWTNPDRHVAVVDAEGEEIVLLETLDELSEGDRRVVDRHLTTAVFNPIIRHVVAQKHEFGITSITAETDRGRVTFEIRSRDDVQKLSATRALFRDADGNHYELPDVNRLDAASRRRLEHYF